MLKEFIEKLEKNFPLDTKVFADRVYAQKEAHAIKNPLASALEVNTLASLVGYVKANKDKLPLESLLVHVESVDSVALVSALDTWRNREVLVRASRKNYAEGFRFGQFAPIENFLIELQSKFIANIDSQTVARVLGNLRSGDVTTSKDDGLTQSVEVKVGVTLGAESVVPNPVRLKPFRTFSEVEQPESPFVLRLRDGGENLPQAALFEADGGKWKLEAIASVAEFLRKELGDIVTVIS